MKKEIVYQKPCKKKICGSEYVKRGCIVQHRTFWKYFYNSMPRKIADLIKAKEGATKYQLHYVGIQVCCGVFTKMFLSNTMLCVGMYLILIHKCYLIRWYDLDI